MITYISPKVLLTLGLAGALVSLFWLIGFLLDKGIGNISSKRQR